MQHTGGGDAAARPGRPAGRAAVRGARDVRAAAAARPGRPVRRRGRRRAVRRRDDLPARRPVRARGDPRGLAAAARLPRRAGRASRSRTSRSPTPATSPARRSRSTRRSPRSRRARGRCLADAAFPSRSAATTRSRCRCCARCTSATDRSRCPLRRAPRHVGHVLRRAVHARHARSAARTRKGSLASDRCAHVGIRGPLFTPQDLVDDAGFGFTIVGAFDYLTAVGRRDRRRGPRAGGRPAGLRVDRRRRAGPGARAGHRHARGGRVDQPGAARDAARASRAFGSSAPTSSRSRPPTTTPRSRRSRPRTSSTSCSA